MKIGLATAVVTNNNMIKNSKTIKEYLRLAQSENVDLLLFGESFLQGFDALNFDVRYDQKIVVSKDDKLIQDLQNDARELGVGLGFGYIEEQEGKIYCSYLIFDKNGRELVNYRRIIDGWRFPNVDTDVYKEGEQLGVFEYQGCKFTIGLCGDFWDDQLVAKIPIDTEIVLWPNFRTFDKDVWVTEEFDDYLKQAKKFAPNVCFVNSICHDEGSIAHGGAFAVVNCELKYHQYIDEVGILICEIQELFQDE